MKIARLTAFLLVLPSYLLATPVSVPNLCLQDFESCTLSLKPQTSCPMDADYLRQLEKNDFCTNPYKYICGSENPLERQTHFNSAQSREDALLSRNVKSALQMTKKKFNYTVDEIESLLESAEHNLPIRKKPNASIKAMHQEVRDSWSFFFITLNKLLRDQLKTVDVSAATRYLSLAIQRNKALSWRDQTDLLSRVNVIKYGSVASLMEDFDEGSEFIKQSCGASSQIDNAFFLDRSGVFKTRRNIYFCPAQLAKLASYRATHGGTILEEWPMDLMITVLHEAAHSIDSRYNPSIYKSFEACFRKQHPGPEPAEAYLTEATADLWASMGFAEVLRGIPSDENRLLASKVALRFLCGTTQEVPSSGLQAQILKTKNSPNRHESGEFRINWIYGPRLGKVLGCSSSPPSCGI